MCIGSFLRPPAIASSFLARSWTRQPSCQSTAARLIRTGAFEGLCTMFNIFLQHLQARQRKVQRGIIVFDEARPSLSRQIRTLLAKFQAGGGRWTSMANLIETVFFFDSRTSRVMQLADFTAFALYRRYESEDAAYMNMIHHRFDHDRSRIHGLKCYPLASTK